jgi:hypothetical protein
MITTMSLPLMIALNSSVKKFTASASSRSLTDTPAMKAKPPRLPL